MKQGKFMRKTDPIKDLTNLPKQNLHANKKVVLALPNLLINFIFLLVALSIIFFIIYLVPVLQEIAPGQKMETASYKDYKMDAGYKKQISLITRDIQRLSRKYDGFTSGQSYIVINTTDNRFSLYRNKKLLREGFCSSGSYTLLQTLEDKHWIFKTPKGKYWIQGKTTNPVWKKPDWAFVEEGLPIPPS